MTKKERQPALNVKHGLTAAKKKKFLEAFRLHGIIGPGLEAAGICRGTFHCWRNDDEEFDQACREAYENAVDIAELELVNRAVKGVEEPVLYKGEPVWRRDPATGQILLDDNFEPIPLTIKRKSDKLLEFYMQANRSRYASKKDLTLSNPDGSPVKTSVEVTFVAAGEVVEP